MKPDLSLVPYRGDDNLRAEVQELREELDRLKGANLYPWEGDDTPCKKCNATRLVDRRSIRGGIIKGAQGPDRVYEPALPRRWWRKATPERLRLMCPYCKAVYYMRTKA